jgi:hypothetical protein
MEKKRIFREVGIEFVNIVWKKFVLQTFETIRSAKLPARTMSRDLLFKVTSGIELGIVFIGCWKSKSYWRRLTR